MTRYRGNLFLTFFFISCLFFTPPAAAEERIFKPTVEIMDTIKAVADSIQTCQRDDARPLGSQYYSSLPDGSLLVMLEVPSYMCNIHNTVIPLIFDPQTGQCRLGEPIDGAVAFFGMDPNGKIWLATQWQIEGTYPTILRSNDGLHWRVVSLPNIPGGPGPFLYLDKMCFKDKALYVSLHKEGDSDENEIFHFKLADPDQEHYQWHETEENNDCTSLTTNTHDWKRKADKPNHRVLFQKDGFNLILPAGLTPTNKKAP